MYYQRIITYVAPATSISIVLALVKPDKVAISRMVDIIMTASRALTLSRELQITTGAKRRAMMKTATSVRAARITKDPKMYTFGSLEIPREEPWDYVSLPRLA